MIKIKKTLMSLAFLAPITPIAAMVSCNSGNELNPKGVLTIARWGNDTEIASQKVAISAFEKKYNTKVKILTLDYGKRIEQISKWAASGSLPDIIETDGSDFSNYATSKIIKPLDVSKIDSDTLSGLVPASLGTMVGHVKDNNWFYDSFSNTAQSSLKDKLWGIPKEFNTLGIYINKKSFDWTKTANSAQAAKWGGIKMSTANYEAYKQQWEGLTNKTNNKIFSLLKFLYINSNGELKKKTSSNKLGPLSFTNDPNRFTQFFSNQDYNDFKSYNGDDIKKNKSRLETAIKGWWTSISDEYLNMNKDGGAITSQGHGYGWNGEAFDKKGVGAVIEGQWFTPSKEIYKDSDQDWDIWTAPTPGLFPQGWALTQTSNDDDLGYKFMSYLASEKGSLEETSKTGANPVNKNALATQYKKASSSIDGTSTDFPKNIAKKILAHGKPFVNVNGNNVSFNSAASGNPLLFTSEYPFFQKSWTDEWADNLKGPVANKTVYDAIIAKVVNGWIKLISDAE